MTRHRTALRGRLRTLATLELVGVLVIGWAVFGAYEAPRSRANIVGFALVTLHLLIGSAYWTVKTRQLRDVDPQPPLIGVFAWLRPICQVALAAGLIALAPAVDQPVATWLPGVVLYGLALAEYVNYFHWQLMHDTRSDLLRLARTRRLRRSHLSEDLRIRKATRTRHATSQ
ncbi:multidrug transporter [Kribbella sp. NBC_01505]|uniref:multidrug transporter n=1 Tax=Kribbella sp. NBC_01505 TaxID=2903580 RepID=UPI00386F3BC1